VCRRIGTGLGLEASVLSTGEVDTKRQRNAQNDEWRRQFLAEANDPSNFPLTISPVDSRKRKKPKWAFWRK
jgi:hypothetical protein